MQDEKKKPSLFGVYQKSTGSLTLGEVRFSPLTAVATTEETKALACEDTSPVKFFATKEAAEKNIAALAAEFERLNPKKKIA